MIPRYQTILFVILLAATRRRHVRAGRRDERPLHRGQELQLLTNDGRALEIVLESEDGFGSRRQGVRGGRLGHDETLYVRPSKPGCKPKWRLA